MNEKQPTDSRPTDNESTERQPGQRAPTERELAIMKVLWDRGEATVRQVYEALRDELGIVQNTVQAFLRVMTEKGLVDYRTVGRSFVYRPLVPRDEASKRLLNRVLERAFDGALDALVESAVSLKRPTRDELDRLRALLDAVESRDAPGSEATR